MKMNDNMNGNCSAAPAQVLPRPRPAIEALHAYVPGEQPKIPGLIKLNTNENPFPPAPEVIEAGRAAVGERLRIYPDPASSELCEEVARSNGLAPEQVIFVNGSDEILRMICTAYLSPGDEAGMLWPTYSLYDTLLATFEGRPRHIPAQPDEPLPIPGGPAPKLFFLANPNPPMGTCYPLDAIESLLRAMPQTLVVLDEAYADFAEWNGVPLLARNPNLLITRTGSKSYSLAGMRIGWGMGHPEVIGVLKKVKDSYNLDRVAQAVGLASLRAVEPRCKAVEIICAQRRRVTDELRRMGFDLPESAANFVFPRRGLIDAEAYFQALRRNNILVRYFSIPELRDGVRVSIGTPEEMDRFLEVTRSILAEAGNSASPGRTS
jgi:histidinol-phosphate aminotransferase